ncbi:MAG: hypothetical protein JRF59_08280 [Deltaproteobacteria bacterium]|nr:hypothetical protein [Deltaproteobacteria bacterium]MBW2347824.1 hypothetical protein [Deltaproteobacteria bacterium]
MLRSKALKTGIWILAAFFLPAGCLPGLRSARVEGPPRAGVVRAPLVPTHLLAGEIKTLSDRLRKGDLTPEQEARARSLLKTYGILESANTRPLSEEEYRRIILLLFHGLIVSKGVSSSLTNVAEEGIARLSRGRKAVLDAFLASDHKAVIDHCESLKEKLGARALPPDIGLIFAVSLAEQGMIEEALKIAEGVAPRMERTPGLFYLYSRIGEWSLRLGRKEKAREAFEKLSDLLDERTRLLSALRMEMDREKPDTAVNSVTGDRLKPSHETPVAQSGPREVLGRVREQVEKGAFDEARRLLASNRDVFEAAGETDSFDQALESIDFAEEKFLSERMDALAREKETLDASRKLLAEEKFDEAISRIEALEKEGRTGPEVRKIKAEAVEKLIRRERNRAAMLFLAARKTADRSRKEKYLRASFHRLKILVERYPSSPLVTKILSNMETIRKEMQKLGVSPEGSPGEAG